MLVIHKHTCVNIHYFICKHSLDVVISVQQYFIYEGLNKERKLFWPVGHDVKIW